MRLADLAKDTSQRTYWVLFVIITLIGIALRFAGTTQQPPIYDEVLAAVGAENYVEHGLFGPIMVDHPQWRSLALRGTMQLFGSGALGLRASSLLLGAITSCYWSASETWGGIGYPGPQVGGVRWPPVEQHP